MNTQEDIKVVCLSKNAAKKSVSTGYVLIGTYK